VQNKGMSSQYPRSIYPPPPPPFTMLLAKLRLWINILSSRYDVMQLSNAQVRRGADKSLARPTSRCRRTESIVSLERGVCSCAELQVFSRYRGWKEACQATRANSTTQRPTNLIEMTNKMQLCRTNYYSMVPWLLNMFRAILSLIIISF